MMNVLRIKYTLAEYLNRPADIVKLLTDCSGDVDEFAQEFGASEHIGKIVVLQAVLCELAKLENAQHRLDWDEQIAAWKDAKRLLAERKAFHWIGEYTPPENTKKNPIPMTVSVSYMRLWLASHVETEKLTGRKKGNEIHAGETDRGAQRILEEMERGNDG